MRRLALTAALLVAPGCAGGPSIWTKSLRYNEQKDYAPTESVEILQSAPDRPYEVIAMLETRIDARSTQPELLESMREHAKGIGADAVVIVERGTIATEKQLVWNFWGLPETAGGEAMPFLRGEAVKYK